MDYFTFSTARVCLQLKVTIQQLLLKIFNDCIQLSYMCWILALGHLKSYQNIHYTLWVKNNCATTIFLQ